MQHFRGRQAYYDWRDIEQTKKPTHLDPLAVAELHDELTVVDEPVAAGQVEVPILPVDGVLAAHLVQPRRVQVGLDNVLSSKLVGQKYDVH